MCQRSSSSVGTRVAQPQPPTLRMLLFQILILVQRDQRISQDYDYQQVNIKQKQIYLSFYPFFIDFLFLFHFSQTIQRRRKRMKQRLPFRYCPTLYKGPKYTANIQATDFAISVQQSYIQKLIMNQPLFKPTSITPPAVYTSHTRPMASLVPQTFTPHYKNQQIVNPRPESNLCKPSNYLNFPTPVNQSNIFPTQFQQAEQGRQLKLDNFARKVSLHEQNSVSTEPPIFANLRVHHSIQRTLDPRQQQNATVPSNPGKKPLFASEMFTNQEFRMDFNSQKQKQNDMKVSYHFGPRPQSFNLDMKDGRLSQKQSELKTRNARTQRETGSSFPVSSGTTQPITHFPGNLKFRQASVSCQTSATKDNNMTYLDSTQNSSQNNSLSVRDPTLQEERPSLKVAQRPASSVLPKNPSPVNFWPLSISPYEDKKQKIPPTAKQLNPQQKVAQAKEKTDACCEFKKKKPMDFLAHNKRKTATQPLPKSFTINDFQLLDKIGKGSFGDVYVAQQKATGFMVVIKKLLKKKIAQMKVEQHLLRQIKIQSFLKHRHLTSIYGFFNDQTYVYLILQIMPDGSLMQVKKKRKISQAETSSYIRQICEGLKYMHTEDIIHRDIKPQNVFLNDGYLKIGDFGCSIFTHSLRSTVIGSLAYISPEQLKQGSYDEKIDVWSLGVMAYEMIFGKSPFQEDIIKIAQNQIPPQLSQLKFPPEVELTPEAKDFLSSMLHLDPLKRLGIAEALKHPFIRKYSEETPSS